MVRHVFVLLLLTSVALFPASQKMSRAQERLMREIHHELVTLPYYGV